MLIKPDLIPKDKKRVNYKIVVPFVVIAAILFYFVLVKVLPKKEVDTGFTVCNLSGRSSATMMAKRNYEEKVLMSDFAQHGESLALFNEEFVFGNKDMFSGKTIFLNNVCHDDGERAYMMDVELDRKLPLRDLDDGFYELELLDGLDRFFLYSDDLVEETFYTMNRNGFVKKVELLANNEMFTKDNKPTHEDKIVYLNVETVEADEESYDIVIDPARLWVENDFGGEIDGMSEADYTYNLALALQEKLEVKELRVKVLRDNETPINFSGPESRLEAAYASNAKYYLSLSFPSSQSSQDYGSTIIYSTHTSNNLATEIAQELSESTDLQASSWAGNSDILGVYPSNQEDGYDKTEEIRESGGILSGAGHVIDNPFGKDNHRGMEAIYLEMGYMSNSDDYNEMHNNTEGIADAIAEAIFKNLEL